MRSPSIRKSFKRYLIGALACVLVLIAYYRDSWFRSSGDRAIARMHLSMNQPPPTDPKTSPRANAALISLVRNSELDGIISSMRYMEKSFNSKFQYPWIFFNDVPFTKEFMERTQAETNAPCTYELVPKEHWDVPEWINQTRMEEAFIQMASDGVKHATQLSYHKMCRWYSGFFFRHPALDKYKYYWRVEPDVKYFCDIEYDVFQFMAENNKTYGFTINIYDDPKSIPTLWPTTMDFLQSHPGYALGANENSYHWLTDSVARPATTKTANGYSTCHFWSNFEIGDLDFWRSKTYTDYFDHLDRTGNFFYERWGDAPVHSVALGLFVPNEQIHWFRDIGYQHSVFSNCPGTDKCHGCQENKLTPLTYWLNGEDCRVNWFKQVCEISRNKGEVDEEMCGLGRKDHAFA